jgi:hypothetical protein
MNDYHLAMESLLADAIEKHGIDYVSDDVVEGVLKTTMPQIVDALYTELSRRSAGMLREHRKRRRGFVHRNFRRWRAGFDLFEQLIVISQETGEAINNALRQTAAEQNDARFEALILNHSRALLVVREIMALMIAGFPDGALGRWRTLHEIAVISTFLSNSDRDTAERYILHQHVTAYRRATNYMEYHERAKLEPIDADEITELKATHDQVVNRYGPGIKLDNGWAAAALKNDRPTFFDLEVATGLDHWRPRYKWATLNTHGAFRPINSTLATSESVHPVLLVGESNSGMTDPAHMAALSLNLATIPLVVLEPNIDRLASVQIMLRLSDEIGETFSRLDHETFDREQRRRRRRASLSRWLPFLGGQVFGR